MKYTIHILRPGCQHDRDAASFQSHDDANHHLLYQEARRALRGRFQSRVALGEARAAADYAWYCHRDAARRLLLCDLQDDERSPLLLIESGETLLHPRQLANCSRLPFEAAASRLSGLLRSCDVLLSRQCQPSWEDGVRLAQSFCAEWPDPYGSRWALEPSSLCSVVVNVYDLHTGGIEAMVVFRPESIELVTDLYADVPSTISFGLAEPGSVDRLQAAIQDMRPSAPSLQPGDDVRFAPRDGLPDHQLKAMARGLVASDVFTAVQAIQNGTSSATFVMAPYEGSEWQRALRHFRAGPLGERVVKAGLPATCLLPARFARQTVNERDLQKIHEYFLAMRAALAAV